MTREGSYLPCRNHQKPIEVGLQLTHRLIMGGGVVIRDCDEVQCPPRCGIGYHEDRARRLGAHLALAGAVTMPGMHVQIPSIPRRTGAYRLAQNHPRILNQASLREKEIG